MNTNTRPASDPPQMMLVLFENQPVETLTDLVKKAKAVHAHVWMALPEGKGAIVDANGVTDPHRRDHDPAPITGPVQGAVLAAHRMNSTHMIFLHPVRQLTQADLVSLGAAITNNPQAVIIAGSDSTGKGRTSLSRWRRLWANFCYRLQTGRHVDDVDSGLYALPLKVMASLPWSQRPHLFMMQAPVKSAWAGVDIAQTIVSKTEGIRRRPGKGWASMGTALVKGLMRLHLTMRAITPWPHRKITPEHPATGKKISALHPLRSIKTLLTENATPWQLCLATALGVFIGALPLIATHTIAILFAAGYFRLNKVATLAASQLCMPPIVPALCIETGYFMRYGNFLTEISLKTLGYQAIDRLYEWLLGALLLGPLLAVFTGALVYLLAIFTRQNGDD